MAKSNEYRNYEFILYSLEECYRFVNICIDNEFDYAYILHDKDLKENLTDYKKEHYHFQIFMLNQKSISRISTLFDIKENYIQIIRDKKKSIRYLLHADNNDKAQYDLLDIKSNFELTSYFSNLVSNESIEMEIIFDYISRKANISLLGLYKYVIQNNIWSTYRRNYSIIKDLITEHNLIYNDDRYKKED